MPRDHTPNSVCRQCGIDFYVKPSAIAKGYGFLCSRKCKGLYRSGNLAERIWAKVDKSGGPDACWPYMGARFPGGYGRTKHRGKPYLVRRKLYEIENSIELPREVFACHSCDNPTCCNPRHIFPGTVQMNTGDMVSKDRQAKGTRTSKAKLTDNDIRRIRQIGRSQPMKATATEFGVSVSLICQIVNNQIWKHIAT